MSRVDVYLESTHPVRMAIRYERASGESVSMLMEQRAGRLQFTAEPPEGNDWTPTAIESSDGMIGHWRLVAVVSPPDSEIVWLREGSPASGRFA